MIRSFCPYLVHAIVMEAARIWDKVVRTVGMQYVTLKRKVKFMKYTVGSHLLVVLPSSAKFRITNKSPSKPQREWNKIGKLRYVQGEGGSVLF